jgi:hypothetical protein
MASLCSVLVEPVHLYHHHKRNLHRAAFARTRYALVVSIASCRDWATVKIQALCKFLAPYLHLVVYRSETTLFVRTLLREVSHLGCCQR